MFQNFFKIAWRNLSRRKFHSFINLFGLSIGLAASIMIISYIFYELSYDKYNDNSDRIYRIFTSLHSPDGATTEAPITDYRTAELAAQTFPEIINFVRLLNEPTQIEYGNKLFTDVETIWADSSYFNIFTHKFLNGSPEHCLNTKQSYVITRSTELKIFGKESGFGKILKVNGQSLKITGIIEDFPINSHLEYDAFAPIYLLREDMGEDAQEGDLSTIAYLLTNGTEDVESLQIKFNQLFQDYYGDELEAFGMSIIESLQPLTSIHLYSKTAFEIKPPGDINNIYIFSVLALFIILIAIINFINLTTANSETRAREIGLRKVLGAHKKLLFKQFIAESMLITLISFIISLALTELFIDYFRELMDSPILLLYKTNIIFMIGLLLSVILIGLIAGSYPALQLSKYTPIEALKGSKSSTGNRNVMLQRFLVVFQFTITTFLLISLNLVYKQISYMKNKDLGFDKEQLIVLDNLTEKISKSFPSLKSELQQLPEVVNLSGSNTVPGTSRSMSAFYKEGESPSTSILTNRNEVNYDYFKTYGIELIAGRAFDQQMGKENLSLILNESAVKALGITDPLNQKLHDGDTLIKVIGVVKDFHFRSLHESIAPLMFKFSDEIIYRISIKLKTQNMTQSIERIEQVFQDFDPNYTFSYQFIDQLFTEMYKKEDRINNLVTYSSVLAIIISVLGLIALSMQTIQKKIREIGIRKVMGAEVGQIVLIFVYDLSKWVLIAAIIAIPLAYIFSKRWLENFEYQTIIGVDVFVFGFMVSLLIAIATVGLISFKAARSNPLDALKYE